MNEWEVDEYRKWSRKVRSDCLNVRTCWSKTETIKRSNQRKLLVDPVGMNGSIF